MSVTGQIVAVEVLRSVASIDKSPPIPARGPSPEARAKGIEARREKAKEAYSPVIGLMTSLRKSGATYDAIASLLNRNDSRTRNGSHWDAGAVRRVLLNQAAD